MGKFRDVYIEKETTISDSQTKIIDINLKDPITALFILYQADNGSTSNQGVHLHDDVDKIELVDGSDVLFSLSGIQCQALDFYSLGRVPPVKLTEAASATQYEWFIIPFGRYIGDPEYYFDPTRFTNPQLKLTHSLTISATAGFATGTGKVTVIARVWEEHPPAPKGFLMAKEKYSWSTASSGDESIDLSTDYPYRLLFLRAFSSGYKFEEILSNIKLSVDADKYIPFDIKSSHLRYLNKEWFGEAELEFDLLRTDGDTVESHINYLSEYAVNARVDMDLASIDAEDDGKVTLQVIKFTTSPSIAKETSDVALNLYVKGVGYHHTLAWPFGKLDDPETWFPAPDFGDIKLKVTQATSGVTATLVTQQLRYY